MEHETQITSSEQSLLKCFIICSVSTSLCLGIKKCIYQWVVHYQGWDQYFPEGRRILLAVQLCLPESSWAGRVTSCLKVILAENNKLRLLILGKNWIWVDFPVSQMVKNLPAMQETQVQCLSQEDPLKNGMATHSSTFVWRIPWSEASIGLQSVESQSWLWQRLTHTHRIWSWQLAPYFLRDFITVS